MADPFINVGVNADNLNNGFQQAARNIFNYSQTIHSTINNVTIDMSRMYNQVNNYNNQVITEFNQVNASLVNMRNNAVTTNNTLTNVIARQEQQIHTQNQIMERTATSTGQIIQGAMTKIGQSFVSIAARISLSGIQASKVYEDMSAKLSVLTGDIDSARDKFWELNALEDKTAIATDKLAQAYLTLGNNGLTRSSKQLEKYAAIAQGTNKDITGLAQNISNFVNGRLQSLKEYGITAERNGNKVVMSFKGEKKEIEATSEALEQYLGQLADTQFGGVLEARTGTLTASFERLQNAWGTLTTRIMDGSSGAGSVLTVFVDNATDLLNWFADCLTNPAFSEFFSTIAEGWKSILDTRREKLSALGDKISEFWSDSGAASALGIESISDYFTQFFNFVRAGFMEVAKQAENAWTAVKGGLSGANEFIIEFGTSWDWDKASKAFNKEVNEAADAMIENDKIWDTAIKLQFKDIEKNLQELKKKREDAAKELGKEGNGDDGKPRKIGGTSGSSGASKKTDTWTSYYNQLIKSQQSGLSELEKAYADYYSKIDEITKRASESSIVDLQQVANARLLVEQELADKIKQIQQDAQSFIWDLTGNEIAKLQSDYQAKLDLLNTYHEQALISEESYTEAVKALYDKFYAEQTKKSGKDKNKNSFFTAQDLDNIQSLTDGLDSMTDAFSNLTQGMSESSATYRALFAIQKSFAVASATMNAIVAWTNALDEKPFWPNGIAAYANAVAMTTNILGQLKSVTMHDKGGYIPAGGLGIVGEYDPELVRGPANVTSRRETADLARSALTGGSKVTINLIEDQSRAGQVDSRERDGDEVINIFVSNIRKGGQMAKTLESTYALRRYGA
ncbi:hypothetical protein SAMN02910344_02270 [Ruminobacter amylophilus]|uniref:Phage tail tape measure protein, lambda family n=1 Tax=Ruminobacter amylophilus TaxID=867 RepID=A0A662ZLI7_9GAMM|nr:hypothetical protein [Ruminobacter amylophilus]SFP77233.1 hypothetical protein SAMN02910344_02270 [Ruminobacter amylophilus]